MATANSDPIQSLANNIVGSMSRIASFQTGKAPYDKSFAVTILGINRKFTGSVSGDDQAALISKYSIPESATEDGINYYTIKINGAYYVIKQNGSFMLYDEVMAYLPNGNWSRMYIDYPITVHSNTDIVIPQTIVSETEPEGEFREGDWWDKIDSDGNITSVYCYLPNSSTGELEWILQYKVATSSGVGEDLGDHNERFNDYENNTVTGGGSYNHVEGRNNTVTGTSSYNHVEGYDNTVENTSQSHVSGYGHTVRESFSCAISGWGNTAGGFREGMMTGDRNSFSGTVNLISGQNNQGSGTANFVGGQANTVGNSTECIVGGRLNNVSSDRCIVNGYSNIVGSGADDSIVNGTDNVVTAICSVTCGRFNVNSASYSVMCGDYGSNSSYPLAVGGGTSEDDRSNIFYVDLVGSVYAKGSYNTIGADYAECFEWADGNPENEDRRGMLVSLDGDRIVPAHGDNILGAVSARPSVVGNAYEEHWHGKYKTDVFGAFVTDKDGKPILSADYDPNREYIPRSKRPEWAAVGLVGRLIVTDNGKCVPDGYVSASNGMAISTSARTNVRMLRRVDSSHIEILIK